MRWLLALFLICVSTPVFAQESLDHLPLPRWATLAAGEVNIRTGPGKRYPIDWVLKKKGLPVEIRQEFENWRLVHEPDGSEGWTHRYMLTSMRNVLVQEKDQPMYANPNVDSRVVARLQKGVIARVKSCQTEWCELKVEDYEGWVPKKVLWGVYSKEILN